MSTFLQIAQNMADRLDGSRPSTIYNADLGNLSQTVRRYREHINLAYNWVLLKLNRANEYRQNSTTLALVAGTESYNIPTGVLSIDQVQIGTDPPMDIIPWDDYEVYKRQFLVVTDTGYPQVCSIYQRKLWFYPTPDEALTANLRYLENMTALNLDADEPDLPADFHRVIQEKAIEFEMVYEGNPAAGAQGMIANELFELARNNSGNHFQQSPRMKSKYESHQKHAIRNIIY